MENFNWGDLNNIWIEIIKKEIFIDRIYEKYFEVNKGDCVMDIGASVGPFTYSILDKEPKHVFCFEPSNVLFQALVQNTLRGPVTCINKGVSSVNGTSDDLILFSSNLNQKTYTITFKKIIEDYNILKIDFLKTDCEGGEYDIFNDENYDFIRNNVKKMVGEWHLSTVELKSKFRKFRDQYLTQFKNFQVMSVDGVDIKWGVWSEEFINYYNEVIIYIDNR